MGVPALYHDGREECLIIKVPEAQMLSACVICLCTSSLTNYGVLRTKKMKVPSVENSELLKFIHLKSGVGQDIALHALPTARNLFFSDF